MAKKYYARPKGDTRRNIAPSKIKPGADPVLAKVFAKIGVPEQKPFKPDPFQLDALNAIERADCLVTAPTGAGKTWIAEQAIAKIREKQGSAWYASPLKALTNTIYAKFVSIFGQECVGILTGDRKENPDAPIVVGTTEILRNQLYDAMHQGQNLATDLIVLDEAHFLGDEDRGVVWEEIMIYLPARIPLLLLSATIGNAEQIAGWLSSIRKNKCVVVEETKRQVPLYPLFFHPSGTLYPLISQSGKNKKAVLYKKVAGFVNSKHRPRLASPGNLPPMGEIIRVLRKYNLLPAIFFLKSRQDCDNALMLCREDGLASDPDRQDRLRERIDAFVTQSQHIADHKQRRYLETRAVGAHHSGQLPSWKLLLESLMTDGLLDAVFATSTVAAGVNFPARTVILFNSDRFNGREFVSLNPTEFHQATGRSGRRGMDNIGFAVAVPGKFMDLRFVAKLISMPASHVLSQIRINFSMVLNLLLSHNPEDIRDLLERSFAAYLATKKRSTKTFFLDDQKYLWRDFMQHLDFMKEEGYISENDRLTNDGKWAAQLRVDQPLMIAESIRLGALPQSDPALLAAVVASFVNERGSDDDAINKREVSKSLLNTFLHIKRMLRPFARLMTDRGFSVNPLYLKPAVTIFNWASGQPWENVLISAGLAEGDLARLILRTSDNLLHLRNLRADFPVIAETAGRAIELIKREPVVSYYET